MRISIRAITSPEVAKILREVPVHINEQIGPPFQALSFGPGVEHFELLVVSVDCSRLEARLDNPGIRLPRNFDYEHFAGELKARLGRVDCTNVMSEEMRRELP